MVRIILITLLFSFSAQADFLGFKTGTGAKSKLPKLTEKLKSLEIEDSPVYEEKFNEVVRSIENAVEEEKLFCSGETADVAGKVIAKNDKQLCFRDLKNNYLESLEAIFQLKQKYLGIIHKRQLARMAEIQKRLKADVEKSF